MKSFRVTRALAGPSSVSYEPRDERGAADDSARSLLRSTATTKLARIGVPGAQIAIRREGSVYWSACAGQLRLAGDRSGPVEGVRSQDRFVVASITKLVVACVALSLVESGELDLDLPVAGWLPELAQGDTITLRMLLSHRSGLHEYFRDDEVRRKLMNEPGAAWSRAELLDAVGRRGREGAPDQHFAYRNSNYIAVGEILARCTGRTIGDLVEERISRPLGLTTLAFAGNEHGVGRLASPHKRRLGRAIDLLARTNGQLPSHAIGEVWTDGGLATSAEDLAILTEGLFEGRLLRMDTVDDMIRRFASPGSAVGGVLGALQAVYLGRVRRSYGLGVAIEQRATTTTLGHEGMYYGWSAATTYDPRTRVTISVVTNLAAIPVPAERLERSLREVMAKSGMSDPVA